CAKAQRQQQMFFVRKRSDSNRCFLCESAATATDVFCAKAQRQQHEGLHDVGHFGNATGRGVLRLSSFISADVWTPAEIN
ncbi:hypothetical protein, partial [Lysinibacillus sp. NPDC056232]|uniref:hypothetical protein n=1 Tax=Lysinibacillus sp. NPDC056232 TaxID=3345756 RepID=UPI0035DD02D8